MKRAGGRGGNGGAIFRNRQRRNSNPYSNPRIAMSSRVSDVSLASSRPSSIGVGGRPDSILPTDKARQAEAVASINAFLASRNSLLCLKTHPVSSGKEITETIIFVLNQLDYHVSKLEDELMSILKSMNCPFKVNKTALRAPNTPHNWPSFLAVIHWLVQMAIYKVHLVESSRDFLEKNFTVVYAMQSYLHFLQGDDDEVDRLDNEFRGKLERQRDSLAEVVGALEKDADELSEKLEALKKEPTEKEKMEKEIECLQMDAKKVEEAISKMIPMINGKEKELEDASKALNVKLEEKRRIDEENLDLKRRVEEQSFNARDAERMKRELLAVERDIVEAEASRNSWEEKMWDVDVNVGRKIQELEEKAIACNQAMRRLKLGNNLQYAINVKGSTPAEVNGIDFKKIMKPEISRFEAEMKKISIEKLDESIVFQKQLSDLSSKTERKRNTIALLQSQIEELDSQISSFKEEAEDHYRRCEAEARRMAEEVHSEAENLSSMEAEASEILKNASQRLHETTRLSEEQIQKEARQLVEVVDAISKYKEHVKSTMSAMKRKLAETTQAILDAKLSFPQLEASS